MVHIGITIIFIAAMVCFIIINAASDGDTVQKAMRPEREDPAHFPEAEEVQKEIA